MKHTPLTHFEKLARRLVEGSFSRLFGGQLDPVEVATRLAQALEENQVDGQAPDSFRIRLNPTDYDLLYRQNPRLASELPGYISRLAREANLTLAVQPTVTLLPKATLARRQLMVETAHSLQPEEPTQIRPGGSARAMQTVAIQALDAFLIIGGRRHVALDQPMMSLGRRTDNDIVLDAPTVSRRHAQIRFRYGRFILYDLSHRGRTLVNDQPTTEHILQPGDVIALAEIKLIYGEGRDAAEFSQSETPGAGQTLLLPADSDE